MQAYSITSLLLAPSAAGADANGLTEAEQYAHCTRQVSMQADAAYTQARQWFQATGALPAQHCMALALYEQRQFAGAASELDRMLQKLTADQPTLWLNIKEQAARAHRYAGSLMGAEKHLDDALLWISGQDNMANQMANLLLQRGEIHALQEAYLLAVQDYDHAYALAQTPDVLLARAKLFIEMGKLDSARDDLETLLVTEPQNSEAQQLLTTLEANPI